MQYEWPRSEKRLKTFSRDLTDIDFIRSLKEPIVLNPEFTTGFGFDRWLAQETNSNDVRPVDYDKFLSDFDPFHEVSIERYDEETGKQTFGKTTLGNFVENLQNPDYRGLYLKDWHAQREFKIPPDFYEDKLPYFMRMDWINFEKWTMGQENPVNGDYKFVYFGSAGSRTLLHYDVFRSFSWSLNISGIKHWLFLPIEKTTEFFKKYPEETDFTRHPGIVEEFGLIEHIQSPGEIVIVPPGWYHQVLNMTECLSVNHNTINVFNVIGVCLELQERFLAVLKELEDQKELRDPSDFADVVEMVLNSDYRITKKRMLKLAQMIETDRKKELKNSVFLEQEPPQDIEDPDFWTNGDFMILKSIVGFRCGCPFSEKHLLQIVIRKIVQDNGDFEFYG
ncbi:hypothetical protein FO519_006804 [Halicephalobus sp. NKZ332]|nr:hypothetical protein FO519_006804 [Halicephalobus sp. NKZ332]